MFSFYSTWNHLKIVHREIFSTFILTPCETWCEHFNWRTIFAYSTLINNCLKDHVLTTSNVLHFSARENLESVRHWAVFDEIKNERSLRVWGLPPQELIYILQYRDCRESCLPKYYFTALVQCETQRKTMRPSFRILLSSIYLLLVKFHSVFSSYELSDAESHLKRRRLF
jgi:hypothetical protein